MAWKKNYSTVRNASWIWYLLAAFCVFMASASFHEDGFQMSLGFVLWVAAATGLLVSASRGKRKEKAL